MMNRNLAKKFIIILLCLGLIGVLNITPPLINAYGEQQFYPAEEAPSLSNEEDSNEEDTDEGDPDEEDPNEEDTDEEDPNEEDTDEEDPDEEDPNKEDPDEEDPDEEDPNGEDPDEEDPNGENPDEPGGDIEVDIEEVLNIINEHTVEVLTYSGFIYALDNVDYTDIYFANDITATAPIKETDRAIINRAKKEQRIYGRAYGGSEIFTFTQVNYNSVNYTIRVLNGSSTAKVTVADMNIVGRNPFGFIQVENSMTGVTTRYENVTYTGPQPVQNRYGTVQFAGVDITLSSGYENNTGRAAEAFQIEFQGRNIIRTSHKATTYPVFTMTRLGSTEGEFHILPGASLEITTPSVLFHVEGAVELSPKLIFDIDSNFFAECGQGFNLNFFNEVNIASNAKVKLVQSGETGDGYALKVRNKLMVDEGAVFELLRPKGGTAAIQMHNSGTITFNKPERVILYANSNLLFAGVGGSQININTDAINLWTKAANGSSAQEPTRIWNKLGNQPLSVEVTWSATNVMGRVTSNLEMDVDPVETDITLNSFALRNSQLMVLGRMGLAIDQVTNDDAKVTGITEPAALLAGSYTTTANAPGTIGDGIADDGGAYQLWLNNGAPLPNSRVYVTAFKDQLRMRQYTNHFEMAQVLEFLSVPDIHFQTSSIPAVFTHVKRSDPNWAITLQDTRKNSPGFRVQASIIAPMTATLGEDTYTIPNGLVYVDKDGSHIPLSDEPYTVYSNNSGEVGEHMVCWEEGQGVLVRVGPGDNLRAGIQYTTSINWTLVEAP